MMDDWLAGRIKENEHAYRAGYEAAGLECHNAFKKLTFKDYQQDWLCKMIDSLLSLCEVEFWESARDRGRLDGYMDIKDGVYASPDAS